MSANAGEGHVPYDTGRLYSTWRWAMRESAPQSLPLGIVAESFRDHASTVYPGRSPLYERLALRVAEDPELLGVAAHARKNTALPNLFFGAVHLLLLKGVHHPLSAFYPILSVARTKPEYSYPYFRSFVLEHEEEIRGIIRTHMVQTNEVGRCACLVPAFELVAQEAKHRPLALIEVGASAGLTLLWDRYGYNYGVGLRCGNLDSPVQLDCTLRGEYHPPIPTEPPTLVSRLGIDLEPVDPQDPESALWLRALVWPEHQNRAAQLERAIKIAKQDPPTILAGDALDLLPSLIDCVPKDTPLCLYHTFTITFTGGEPREKLLSLLSQGSWKRDLFLVWMEWSREWETPLLGLVSFKKGTKAERILARCHPHGEWLEWLDSETQ